MTSASRLAAILIATTIMLFSATAQAWHAAGHMMVAAVAWDQMTPAARARATQLLKLNPSYDSWVQGVPDQQKDKTAFVRAATWPDDIKNDPSYINDGEEPTNPNAAANVGYSDKLMHKYWHYIDLPFSPDQTPLIQPKNPNAETQIKAFTTAIASATASDDVKSYDVVWLIHMVGDVHQPLHATSRFTKALPQGDEGGNQIKVVCKPNCGSNLHSFWDGLMDRFNSPSAAIATAAKFPKASAGGASISDPHVWITESFTIAKRSVYRASIRRGKGPYTLTVKYKSDATAIGRHRIALAGARLARLFNTSLK
jgi:S1/P1 nuclease